MINKYREFSPISIILTLAIVFIASMILLTSGCASRGSVADLQEQIFTNRAGLDKVDTQTNKNTLAIQELDADTAKKIDLMFEKSQYK
jgi:hypothetical protein